MVVALRIRQLQRFNRYCKRQREMYPRPISNHAEQGEMEFSQLQKPLDPICLIIRIPVTACRR